MMDIRAFETELEKLRSGFSFDTTKPCGMYVAALTRAEAAEGLAYERLEAALFAEQRATDAELRAEEAAAEANDAAKELIELKERFDAMESIAKYDQQQLIEMATRVAELEAETTRLRQELEVQQGRVKTLLNRNSAQAARMRARMARAEAAEAEAQGWR